MFSPVSSNKIITTGKKRVLPKMKFYHLEPLKVEVPKFKSNLMTILASARDESLFIAQR